MNKGKVLTILGWVSGIALLSLPLTSVFGSNWPLAIIGEERWVVLDTWTRLLPLLIPGIILFITLIRVGGHLGKNKEANNANKQR